jgi:predicted lactoylglutathione lyase
MSERNEFSTQVLISPEQMKVIVGREQEFLSIFKQQLQEQTKTNELLTALIQALNEEPVDDDDAEPLTYMDGTPVNGGG